MKIKNDKSDIRLFFSGLAVVFSLIAIRLYGQARINAYSAILLIAICLFLISLIKVELLAPFYRLWMRVAQFISRLVTNLILMVVFYLVVTPIGLWLRLWGKDLLGLKKENRDSYWIEKKEIPSKDSYLKQF